MPNLQLQRPSNEALLGQTELFGPLSLADREAIAKRMHPVSFVPGQLVFSRGDDGHELYLVLEGRIRLSVLTAEGRELALAHAVIGDLFGEIATLDGGKRTAGATSITASRALSLTRAALADLMAVRPRIVEAIVRFLCQRLRRTDDKLEAIALQSIEVRLARFILAAIERPGLPTLPATGNAIARLGISQGELGLLLGATRSKVNGALSALEGSGAIQRDGDRLICDVGLLK